MDDLLELVMDVLLEGAAETAASPKAPLRVRIILILILGIGYLGVAGLVFLSLIHISRLSTPRLPSPLPAASSPW